jgi:hypothetical protein
MTVFYNTGVYLITLSSNSPTQTLVALFKLCSNPSMTSPYVLGADLELLPVDSDALPIFVPTTALPHIQRVLAIVIVVLDNPVNAISHLAI